MHGEYNFKMVSLITEKFSTKSPISYNYQTYSTPSVQSSVVVPQVQELSQESLEKKKNNLVLPLSLITGGGILLYYGLRKPKPETLYNNFVRAQINEMQSRIRVFTAFVKSTIDAKFDKAPSLIDNYKVERFVEPTADLGPLRVLKDPRKLLNAQDIAFDAVADVDKAQHRLGAPDFTVFSGELGKMQREADHSIGREQRVVKLELSDYVQTRGLKNEKFADVVEASENRLIEMVSFLTEQTEQIRKNQMSAYTKRLYIKMADTILESRSRIRQAKINIVEATFERMSHLLGVRNLKPTYGSIPEAIDFEKLSARELAPTKLPKKFKKIAPLNVYLDAIQKKDFSKLTDKDLYEIFYSAPYDNNLQDLGFLIDRLRLTRAVDKFYAPDKKSVYDVIIPKLEYLSKKLHEFGRRELLKNAGKDFDVMSLEQKKAALWYVSRVSRRLGYISVQEMDAAIVKENRAYAELNIRKYMPIFKDNPNIYFN